MKKLFYFLFVIGGLTGTHAQDTIQFAANLTLVEPIPPFEFPHSGFGRFTLDGNIFRYHVQATPYGPWETSQIIAGPEGPPLFDLVFTGCTAPIGTNLGSCSFRGRVELTEPLIADLLANHWYVTAAYRGSIALNVQGQIQVVPEPATFALLGLGGVAGLWNIWRSRRALLVKKA